ncbi:UDP-N-acetylmuramoyl-L-alanyl-D-glutamate--2,6-diaminopimelate ligase [Rickettsiales endosymbiont of Paramecium tredecaurelia]|uniref:Mur ligase family protein n=1 Tax=Candidatus Sarmatiella mevalonica TaxID=2770581 RepID=UPI001924F41D|nr:UDP-N-acetylmuramoyl-L-alanyl-D-glutamate--2,6-diaminopimelate ligase [Candidatus Sarmatiella mevalonica]MBL3284583.1 UDP-N-acetylmuramoyl-L-alanyl-D-glutamate--2,6-diaminopimelate ligase [Candidatus Sarmatiella mevalonica]
MPYPTPSALLAKKIIQKYRVMHAFLFSLTNFDFYIHQSQGYHNTRTLHSSKQKRQNKTNASHICVIFAKDNDSHLECINQIHEAFVKDDYVQSKIVYDDILIILTNDRRLLQNYSHHRYIIYHIPDLSAALREVAQLLYLHNIPNKIVGITGTNGKTSTIFYTQQILKLLHKTSVTIGTLGLITEHQDINNEEFVKYFNSHPTLTTPDLLSLARLLNICKTHGVNYALLEVSSHALAQNRIIGLELDVAAFCNFSQDHLDYHETMQEYFLTKAKIVNMLKRGGKMLINADILTIAQKIYNKLLAEFVQKDEVRELYQTQNAKACMKLNWARELTTTSRLLLKVERGRNSNGIQKNLAPQLLTQTFNHKKHPLFNHPTLSLLLSIINSKVLLDSYVVQKADLNGQKVLFTLTLNASKLRQINAHQINTHLNIVGSSQIANLHLALNVVATLRCAVHKLHSLQSIESPKGRMQRVECATYNIFIDYAHTPDALSRALRALRNLIHNNGRLVVVFGAGGQRDKTKRVLMGRVASEIADRIIITNDNPRFEEPSQIAMQIIEGCPTGQICLNREEAIALAIKDLTQRDALLVCGKGHEQYQVINGRKYYFDDYEVCLKYLHNITPSL